MVSRQELYELVWTEPMTKVSERFDVSGSYLARICTLLNVPRPERGHWAKLAVNKASPRPPLPEVRPGDPTEWTPGEAPKLTQKPKAPPRSRKRAPVPVAPNTVHGLVRGARIHFENGRPGDDGGYLRPYKRLLLDLNASPACLDKALTLASDLYNAFDSAGHRVMIASQDAQLRRPEIEEREAPPTKKEYHRYSGLWSPQRPTVVYIGTVAIGLAIVEMSEHVLLRYLGGKYIRESDYVASRRHASEYTFTTTKDLPSGRLRVIAYSPYGRVTWAERWHETAKAPLGASIATIVRTVERMATQLVERLEEADRQAEIAHQKWLADMERYERAEDQKRVQASVRESHEELEQVIQQWSKVMATERFLAGIEEKAAALPTAERASVLDRRALARQFLGTQDPLDFLRAWKTPGERYTSRFGADDRGAARNEAQG